MSLRYRSASTFLSLGQFSPPPPAMAPPSQALDEVSVEAQYNILQQLLPGETLQPNKLAMGQTYEQLDKGETGRLGERGQEKIPTTPFGRND